MEHSGARGWAFAHYELTRTANDSRRALAEEAELLRSHVPMIQFTSEGRPQPHILVGG
jgi:hypothetical protein